jgi:hypothetical protein
MSIAMLRTLSWLPILVPFDFPVAGASWRLRLGPPLHAARLDVRSTTLQPRNLALIGMVETRVERNGTVARERRYYLSSTTLDAKTFAVTEMGEGRRPGARRGSKFLTRWPTYGERVPVGCGTSLDKPSDLQAAARTLGLQLVVMNVRLDSELETAFSTFSQQHVGAVLATNSNFFNRHSEQLATLAARHALPAVYPFREYALAGGLMSYGSSLGYLYHQVDIRPGFRRRPFPATPPMGADNLWRPTRAW